MSDPLGRPVEAGFALLPDGSAVVEMAQASGLSLVDESERDAWAASTRGTGELIAAAAEAGAERVIVTVGGSATTDGGAGAIEALDEAGLIAAGSRWTSCATSACRSRTLRAYSRHRRAPTPPRSSGSSGGSPSWPPRFRATRAASP